MPLSTKDQGTVKFPEQKFQTLGNFKRGVITLINNSKLPKNALERARNLFLIEDGQPTKRPGIDWFGSALPNGAAIDGFDYFDFAGVIHLIAVGGGIVYRSTDDGATWTQCTGGTLTAGKVTSMNQYNSFLYITTGGDQILRYDGTTVLQSYGTLVTPAAPTAATTPGSPGTTFTYFYKVSAVNQIGFSAASPSVTVTHGVPRDSWDRTTNYVTLTLPAYQVGQTRTDIYISTDDLNYYYLDSVTTPTVTYKDDGSAIIVPSTLAPTDNTTTGPMVAELTNVGSRMYGTRDPSHRYRIWFTSGSAPFGSFSNGYDGGYLDWQPGGKYFPVHVEDYRDGKGTPLATVWCDSADGTGCIVQMSLDTETIGSISVTVPSAYRLPGSRGTSAPGSVVNVLNDFMFYNRQAFYNLGSRAQFLNLLSTDESSANIRPSVRKISTVGAPNICSSYFDANVYFSLPYGDATQTTNNYTAIYNTELKAWLPEAFSVGFKKFLHYTDLTGTQRLLVTKPGDNRLSEVSRFIQGDYGEPIHTLLLTGLYPMVDNRFEFMVIEEGEVELSEPNDVIQVDLLGIGRDNVLRVQASRTITENTTSAGWSTFAWSTKAWSDTTSLPTVAAATTVKRYFVVQREINAFQWRIITSTGPANYILRTLQTHGTETDAGKPASWRLP